MVEVVDVSATVQAIGREKRTVSLKRPDGKLVITRIDKYDLGTGPMSNVAALMIPYQYLDKVILSHLQVSDSSCDSNCLGVLYSLPSPVSFLSIALRAVRL